MDNKASDSRIKQLFDIHTIMLKLTYISDKDLIALVERINYYGKNPSLNTYDTRTFMIYSNLFINEYNFRKLGLK